MIIVLRGTSKKWFKVTVSPLQGAYKNCVLIIFEDITKEMKMIQSLLESEEKYRQHFKHSITGIILAAPNGDILDVNPAACRILGYSKFDLIDRERKLIVDESNYAHRKLMRIRENTSFFEDELFDMNAPRLFHENERNKIDTVPDVSFESGSGQIIGNIVGNHKKQRTYHIYLNRFENNEEDFLVDTGGDLTEFPDSERELEKNYSLMTQLFENAPLAKVMVTPDNKVQRVNKGFTDQFGYSEEELTGQNVNKLIAFEECRVEAARVAEEAFNGNANQQETVLLKKDRSTVPVLLTTVPVIRNNGDIIACYGIYIDHSSQRKMENKLQESLLEKDIRLQEVHHRVKNNLAIIAGLLELQILNEENESARQKLRDAHDRVYSIAKIHETLYSNDDVARIRFDNYLNSIIQSMPEHIQTKNNNLKVLNSDEPLIVNINQAVPLGLLINKILHLGSNNKKADEKAELSYTIKGNRVTLVISGLNIEMEDLRNIFPEFAFQNMLIETFIKQVDADVEIIKNDNKTCIESRKIDSMKGSSSSMIDQSGLLTETFVS